MGFGQIHSVSHYDDIIKLQAENQKFYFRERDSLPLVSVQLPLEASL